MMLFTSSKGYGLIQHYSLYHSHLGETRRMGKDFHGMGHCVKLNTVITIKSRKGVVFMRKSSVRILIPLTAALILTGCSSSNAAYLKNIKASRYVDVCDYVGIEVEADQPEVTDEEVDLMVETTLENSTYNEEVTDRTEVEDGDIVSIDYVGTLDGEEFDGGSAEDYELTIGSGTFIDGFEEGLIGSNVGDTLELDLTFPDDYSEEDLAGQDVVFTVTINSILEEVVPELTDEWAAGLGYSGVDTVEDYEDYMYDYLMSLEESSFDSEVQDQLTTYVVENSTFKQDPPEAMLERFADEYTEYCETYASYYGLELDDFLVTFMGADEDDPEAAIDEYADEAARQLIVFKAISDKEGLNPSKSEWETELSVYAAYYGYESIEEFKEYEDAESVRENLMMNNVLGFLQENCVVVEPSEDEEETEETTEDEEEETEEETAEDEEETEEETEDTAEEEITEESSEEADSSAEETSAEEEQADEE